MPARIPHRRGGSGRPFLRRWLAAALLVLAAGALAPTEARTLRLASAFDPNTLDPHAIALLYHSRVATQVYEGLVNRGRDFKLEPSLALSWQATSPTRWRFRLRPGVRFHDGAPFSADDAVFSIERALARNSQRATQLRGITGARKVDDLTLDIDLAAPDAVLPEKLWLIAMMSRPWAQKHGVLQPQDYNGKQETFAVRNANGTGPYRIGRYEPDRRLVLIRNDAWWGWKTPAADARANVTEAVYSVIQSDATRLAALASGEVDFVIDPPFQDVARLRNDKRLKLTEVGDIGTQYLGFDQARAALDGSDVRDRNPFKDVRVRRAVYQAIDIDTIIAKVLRGQARPAGSHLSALVDGHVPELEQRLPYDPAAARRLLAEAGYANGFAVTLDCVNVTFRAAVCQAIASMLAQVNIRVTFQPSSSFFEFGWTPSTDPWAMLNATVRSFDGAGSGAFNGGRYSNAKLDALIDAIRVEPDLERRRALTGDALRLLHAELPLIPLYRRTLTWVMRPNVHVAPLPNDLLELRWVRID